MSKKATETEFPAYCMICKTSGRVHSHRMLATPAEAIQERLKRVIWSRQNEEMEDDRQVEHLEGQRCGLEFALRALGVEP